MKVFIIGAFTLSVHVLSMCLVLMLCSLLCVDHNIEPVLL